MRCDPPPSPLNGINDPFKKSYSPPTTTGVTSRPAGLRPQVKKWSVLLFFGLQGFWDLRPTVTPRKRILIVLFSRLLWLRGQERKWCFLFRIFYLFYFLKLLSAHVIRGRGRFFCHRRICNLSSLLILLHSFFQSGVLC